MLARRLMESRQNARDELCRQQGVEAGAAAVMVKAAALSGSKSTKDSRALKTEADGIQTTAARQVLHGLGRVEALEMALGMVRTLVDGCDLKPAREAST